MNETKSELVMLKFIFLFYFLLFFGGGGLS